MKESAQAAFSYIRSRTKELKIDPDFHEQYDIHIHVPEGAVPKDGPSAGITMATALISALTGRPVRKEVGMTGEITLRGRVLPIGGLKEKTLSAHRAGLKKIILPKENEKDLDDIPESVRKELTFVLVSHMDEVLKHALAGEKE
jgi:ATP-dependent Lon protease